MKPLLPIFLLVFTAAHSLCAQTVFGQFKSLEELIPPQFSIIDSASGDINNDNMKDIIIILRNQFEYINSDTTRPLLLLIGNNEGKYKLLEQNNNVVLCMGCGGIYGDPYAGITIKDGFFSIEHYGGSAWKWTRVITFKFNKTSTNFILHRDAGLSWHTSNPDNTTENLYNKDDFGKISFAQFNYRKNW